MSATISSLFGQYFALTYFRKTEKLTNRMGEKKWLSVHLYYNQPWHQLICEAVEPLVRAGLETGLVEQFFFIRYWHKGPHIRLRFFGHEDQLSQLLIPNLKDQYHNYLDYNPSYRNEPTYTEGFPESEKWYPNNSLQMIDYQPEYHRYGGPDGVSLAEKQFDASSKLVFTMLRDKANNWTYEDAMGKAIILHLSFAHALRMDATEALKFFHLFSDNWMRSAIVRNPTMRTENRIHEERQKLQVKYQRLFRSQKDKMLPYISELWSAMEEGQPFEEPYLNEWMTMQSAVGKELILLQAEQKLRKRPEQFQYNVPNPEGFTAEKLERWMHLADYMHLSNNRLGINNEDEPYLAFLLSECLERVI